MHANPSLHRATPVSPQGAPMAGLKVQAPASQAGTAHSSLEDGHSSVRALPAASQKIRVVLSLHAGSQGMASMPAISLQPGNTSQQPRIARPKQRVLLEA